MFNSTQNKPTALKVAVVATFIAALAVAPLAMAQEHQHGGDAAASKEVTGEIVDNGVTNQIPGQTVYMSTGTQSADVLVQHA